MKSCIASVLDTLFDPFDEILTPEVARKIAKIRFDSTAQARINKLAAKCNEGELTDAERQEYETYVHVIDFMAILQSKARLLLKQLKTRK
jgi:hypothetical protein